MTVLFKHFRIQRSVVSHLKNIGYDLRALFLAKPLTNTQPEQSSFSFESNMQSANPPETNEVFDFLAIAFSSLPLILKQAGVVNGSRYSRMDQVKFVEASLKKFWSDMVCSRPYHFKFFKGCLSQVLLGPFLSTSIQV